jgi:Carboxypeptidase regulatory-like domain
MKRLSFLFALIVCVVAFFVLSATPAFAQGETGSVTGAVSDAQGGTVAGATVTLTDVGTKSQRTSTTNDTGRYYFASVSAGSYDITISKTGFKVHKVAGQKVSVGNQLTLDVALEVGALTETVIVTSQAGTELQTANATIGNTISLKDLELLPNLGRDATSLLGLQPGVTPRGDIGGSYMDQNTFTVDGGNNTDDMAGNTIGYINNFTGQAGTQTNGMASGVVFTPIESVEEFKVSTFGQTNDFNASSGALVQMVTRRGTDQWHGAGYGYYYATNHGAANSWSNNHTAFNKGIVPPSRPACSPGTTLSTGDNNCVMPYTPLIPNHRSRFGFSFGGPVIPWKVLGGKTYLFFNYEGFRFPGSGTFERAYPTDAFRKGVIQVPDSKGVYQPYNLNPFPITVTVGSAATNTVRTVTLPAAGTGCPVETVAPGTTGSTYTGAGCDPRGLGMSSTISQLWTKYLPLPNDPLAGDQYNTQGYLSTIRTPLTSNNYVGRIDHDFNGKNRFFTSFRASKLLNVTTNQVDIGGLVGGGTFGQYNPTAPRPQLGELWVIGLTTNISSRLTNDLRLSYLWNWWQWSTQAGPPQLPGLGGALEIATAGTASSSEAATALIPYNVNNQSVRQRVWDGQDKVLRDDLTWVKGNHLFQFGGNIQKNFNYHTRTDNGSTINNYVVYQIASGAITFPTSSTQATNTIPGTAQGQASLYRNLASSIFGLVGLTQVIYTRTGSNLTIQPIGTQAKEQSTIKYYSGYFADTWRLKPTLTLTAGLSYMYETPPVEKNGAQVELVYQDGSLVHSDSFLAQRKAAALAGQAYAPILGFETTNALGIKYPYTPFKGGWSPRVALAWNPNFKSGFLHKLTGEGQTVIRGGIGRTWGRINGVNQVLVPLLGPGLLQPVTCSFALSNGTCGSATTTLSNAFRVGPDGLVAPLASPSQTLPQPFFPGVNGAPVAGDSTVLDPDYKPEKVDSWDLTIQRQITRRISFEVGYMGKRAKNIFEEIDIDAVPYMMTKGGQTFADAYKNLYLAICGAPLGPTCSTTASTFNYTGAAQPFFEGALTPGSGYCAGFANCTAAVASKQLGNFKATTVSDLWAALNNGAGWTLGRTMLSSQATAINTTTSLGYSNYNAMFATVKLSDWHGINSITNFTWGKALGTAQIGQYNSSNQWLDIWNPKASYGPQLFDIKYIFNAGFSYRPDMFRGMHGWKGMLLDGWSVSPFFTAQSGFPIGVTYSEGGTCGSACQAFGQVGNSASSSTAFEYAIPSGAVPTSTLHRNITGSGGIGTVNSEGNNVFADPASVYGLFRRCVLGLDASCNGTGNLRGLNRWNADATLAKDLKFTERVGATFTVQFTNVFNHRQPTDPTLSLTTPTTFGRITGSVYAARQMELGLRIHF